MRREPTPTGGSEAPAVGAGDPRLRWYPARWRARYGDEFAALLDDEYGGHLPITARWALVVGGLRERGRQSGLTGDSAAPADALNAGVLMVLAAWTAFAGAGASFAKFSEHFDQALAHQAGAHHVPDVAFSVLQAVAAVVGGTVVVGLVLALPALVRYLRAEGWAHLRRPVRRASAATALTATVTVPVLVWAHALTPPQRSGFHWYGALFLAWAGLIAVTAVLWLVVAVAAGRRLQLSPATLRAEATLAAVVAVGMAAMVGATVVWWAAMANAAPAFLQASPGGAPGSSWDLWLVATVAVMVVALGVASCGLVRGARAWARMRVA
jgi:hypothetical protein